ncbi:MAG: hypothetical protein CMK59_07995 [Proteobacteria bacterium]|nr:hypothetical protein [Pseudomonadota bacterium]
MRKIGLIGVGCHAKRIYVPWLMSNHQHKWTVAVDLSCQETKVREAVAVSPPEHLIFSNTPSSEDIDPKVFAQLEKLQATGDLDTLIICTDPLNRRQWLLWGIQRGLDLIIDKPLTAPYNPDNLGTLATEIKSDFEEILHCAQSSSSKIWIQAQRRAHCGYKLVKDVLRQSIEETSTPITHLDVYHADGMWVLPNEWNRDHHPYRHKWGKILHSGYHFIDLASFLLELSDPQDTSWLHFNAYATRGEAQVQQLQHQNLLSTANSIVNTSHGELDLSVLGQIQHQHHPRTTIALNLLQNSFSRRSSNSPPKDPYKGAGRVRHERINVQIGPFINVQVHSYQAHEISDPNPIEVYGPGHIDHFDVHIYRNPLLKGKRYEQHQIGSTLSHPHNESARIELLNQFLNDDSHLSSIQQHKRSIEWICSIYSALHEKTCGGAGVLKWTE